VAYGEYALKNSSVFEWHMQFKEGWEDVQDDPKNRQKKIQRTDANQQCYLEVLTRIQESVQRKSPELWPDKWIIHHDSAPAHDALRVHEFLAKNAITEIDHPPYSPDLAPCDFRLFPKLKNALKGQRFADHSDIQHNMKTLLRGILEDDFQGCFW
jgi:hypothetical protein